MLNKYILLTGGILMMVVGGLIKSDCQITSGLVLFWIGSAVEKK